LLERRSLTELEVILTERLEELHRSRVVPKSRKSA
ncbi:MAG: polymerase-binding protein, partial [Frankiaceae bacterium]|nr:polymerase-binding protein [Frankiaceae bacterium]